MAKQEPNHINGILLVDKTPDWTSHDVVNLVRRRFNLDKVGHCGTLDPMATGLLVILLGKATKLQDVLMGHDKTYVAELTLGVSTASQDATGETVATSEAWRDISEERLRDVLASFCGPQLQIPPMVSAIKHNGQPLYKMARRGEEIEREARPIVIHSLNVLGIDLPKIRFEVRCSKGTYIRTLCADIGDKLGCLGMMSALRRVCCGEFVVDGAATPEDIKTWEISALQERMMPLETLAGVLEKAPGK